MSKKCDRCAGAYRGFGPVCAPCRRTPSDPGAAKVQSRDLCSACGKRVYCMELCNVGELTFHKDCFRCSTCSRKLETHFQRSELGFFCPTHFAQISKVTAGYSSGTGPTRNSTAASLVESMVSRSAAAVYASDTAPSPRRGQNEEETVTARYLASTTTGDTGSGPAWRRGKQTAGAPVETKESGSLAATPRVSVDAAQVADSPDSVAKAAVESSEEALGAGTDSRTVASVECLDKALESSEHARPVDGAHPGEAEEVAHSSTQASPEPAVESALPGEAEGVAGLWQQVDVPAEPVTDTALPAEAEEAAGQLETSVACPPGALSSTPRSSSSSQSDASDSAPCFASQHDALCEPSMDVNAIVCQDSVDPIAMDSGELDSSTVMTPETYEAQFGNFVIPEQTEDDAASSSATCADGLDAGAAQEAEGIDGFPVVVDVDDGTQFGNVATLGQTDVDSPRAFKTHVEEMELNTSSSTVMIAADYGAQFGIIVSPDQAEVSEVHPEEEVEIPHTPVAGGSTGRTSNGLKMEEEPRLVTRSIAGA